MSTPPEKRIQRRMAEMYLERFPLEAAQALQEEAPEDIASLVDELGDVRGAEIINQMNPVSVAEWLDLLEPETFGQVAAHANPSRLALILSQCSESAKKEFLNQLSASLQTEIVEIMAYPAGTAGSVMDTKVMTFLPDQTVKSIITKLRKLQQRKVHTIYVVDESSRLLGSIPLQEVVMANNATTLRTLMSGPMIQVQAMSPREDAVDLFTLHKLTSLPVVDVDGILLGVVRQEAVYQVLQQDASANIQTMVGAGRDERALSSPLFSVRKRLPWLTINLLTAFLAAAVVGFFETTIAQVTALAVLLPVVAGQSGNTGAQALAVTMRGLALREVRARHWPALVFKESIAGFLNGIAIAVVTGLGVLVWSSSIGLSLVISAAMVIAMSIAGAAGATIPIVLTSLGQDPAQSSSIILTTVTDVFGFLSFLGLATLFISFL